MSIIPEKNNPSENLNAQQLEKLRAIQRTIYSRVTGYSDNGLSDRERRERYFAFRGLACPANHAERENFIRNEIHKAKPDFEASIMAFDAEGDSNCSISLFDIGYVLDAKEHPDFDPALALHFNFQSALRGQATAAYNIAVKYSNGHETTINLDEYLYWLLKSIELGKHDAKHDFAQKIRQYHHERYGFSFPENLLEYAKLIDNQLYGDDASSTDKNKNAVSIYVALEIAKRHGKATIFSGEGCSQVISFYQETLQQSLSGWSLNAHSVAASNLAERLMLGPNDYFHGEKIISLLEETIEKAQRFSKVSAEHFAKKQLAEARLLLDDRNARPLLEARSLLLGIHDCTPDSTQDTASIRTQRRERFMRQIETRSIKVNDTLRVLIKWTASLASAEGWEDSDYWNRLRHMADARALDFDLTRVERSTQAQGPRYNAIAPNGLPILGGLEAPQSPDTSAHERQENGSYVPDPGVIHLQAIRAEQDGDIRFDCVISDSAPALLVADDFHAAIALVFGNPERIIWPSLSMEDFKHQGVQDQSGLFKMKEWSPAWIGHTDFGRTLYITDNLIGSLCWRPTEFHYPVGDDSVSAEARANAIHLVKDILLTGGREGTGQFSRVMLKPEHVEIQGKTITANGRVHFDIPIADIRMRVDGSYILIKEDGEENRLQSLNDTFYQQGRTTQKLTDRYGDIARLLPVFERARQMMGLFYGLVQLRNSGFRPSASFQQAATATLHAFEKREPLAGRDLVCLSLPLPVLKVT